MDTEKTAHELAKSKSIREQRVILVFQSERDPDDFWVVPEKTLKEDHTFGKHVERYIPEKIDEEDVEQQILEIEDHETLEEGDRVLIDDSKSEVINSVSSRQIVTNFGNKFRRSDGKEWGVDDGKQITKKVI
jgi:hypothetical protein